jgi:hypothetical protein
MLDSLATVLLTAAPVLAVGVYLARNRMRALVRTGLAWRQPCSC